MGLIVATAVAAAPAIGCDDDGTALPADTGAPTDTGSSMTPAPQPDAGSAEATVAASDAATDMYPDGIRG